MNITKTRERLDRLAASCDSKLLRILAAELTQELYRHRVDVLAEFREAAAAAAARIEARKPADHLAGLCAGGLSVLVEVAAQGALEEAGRAERIADQSIRRDPLGRRVLLALREKSARTPSELANACGVRNPTQVSRALRELKSRDFVREVEAVGAADRREKPVRLTARGLESLQADAVPRKVDLPDDIKLLLEDVYQKIGRGGLGSAPTGGDRSEPNPLRVRPVAYAPKPAHRKPTPRKQLAASLGPPVRDEEPRIKPPLSGRPKKREASTTRRLACRIRPSKTQVVVR